MKAFRKKSSKEKLRYLGIRLGCCLAAILIYFSMWRPLRVAITEYVVYPQVEYVSGDEPAFRSEINGKSILVRYTFQNSTKQLQYRPQFGFFFLISLLSLFFLTSAFRHYGILLGLHGAASILTYLFLLVGVSGLPFGFIVVDAISGYLTPALSLGFIPLVASGKI